MKTTTQIIQDEFCFLLESGYNMHVEDVTFIYKKIIYQKKNITVILHFELMPEIIDFEIVVEKNDFLFSITQHKCRNERESENNHEDNVIYQDVYEYTGGKYNEDKFYMLMELVQKDKTIKKKNKFVNYLLQYKLLLHTALIYIEKEFGC